MEYKKVLFECLEVSFYSRGMLSGLNQKILPQPKNIPVGAPPPSSLGAPPGFSNCKHHKRVRSATHDFGKELLTFTNIEQNLLGHDYNTEEQFYF